MKKKDRPAPPPQVSTPVWMPVFAWGTAVWVFFTVLTFDRKFPTSIDPMLTLIQQLLSFSPMPLLKILFVYLKSFFLFSVLVVAAAAWGARICPQSLMEKISFLGQFVLSLVLGYLALSMAMTAIGFAGLFDYSAVVFTVFAISGVVISRQRLKSWFAQIKTWQMSRFFDSPVYWILFVLCGLALMMALVPEVFYDSLVYHLGLPQLFANEGRIVDTPYVYFSRFPMMLNMLYVLALKIDSDILAKLINWSLMMAGLGAASVLCQVMGWGKQSAWAALLLAAMPVVQLNTWSTAVDSAMGVFVVLSVLVILLWRQNAESPVSWFWIAGLFAGGTFAIKYTGVVAVIVVGAFALAVLWKRAAPKQAVIAVLGYSLCAMLLVAPWLVRNKLWTGNPVYPIMSSVFESRHMNVKKMEDEKGLAARSKPTSIMDYVTYPWKQTMKELTNFNFIGPMTLACLPLLLFIPWKGRPDIIFLGIVSLAYFLFAMQFAGDIRYLLPGFFLLAVLVAGGISVAGELKPVTGFFVKAAVVIASIYQMVWLFQVAFFMYKPSNVLLGKEPRATYSATTHDGLNLFPWNVMDAELRALPEPCRIYILGNEQVFGFPKRFVYSSCHDDTPIVIWANESRDANALYEKLKAEGITHVLFNAPEAMRLKGYDLFGWSDSGLKTFYEFAKQHLNTVQVKPIDRFPAGLFLFEVKERVDVPQPFGSFENYFGGIFTQKP